MATTTISHGSHFTSTSSTVMASCTTAVPGMHGYVPFDPNTCNSNYHFYPSFTGNLAFATVFGLSTVAHLIEAIAFRKKFCWVVIMGGAWETGAFIARTLGSRDQQEKQFAFWGQLLFILAPLWVNAFVYMTVARMVHLGLADKQIWNIKATKLTVLFVWIDVVCFLVQAGGGGMLSNKDEPNIARIGTKNTSGASLQQWPNEGFNIGDVGGITSHRGRFEDSETLNKLMARQVTANFRVLQVRTVYRLIEFGPGLNADNPLLTKEIYPFALDALPMSLALTMLNAMHPGFVLRGTDREFPSLSRAETTAIQRQKKEERQQSRATDSTRKNREYIRMEHIG
ncbi:hypothetical protein BFJ63_vAg17029 [Fusarium oxysporum f. sp. narcissi]|uniref:Uncharacterized protein n=1 Tax=Fusarium oxysporum f. sp. narcissi TaxID=451672 RepID=A0A4Q2UZP4_FUSOX|nr:hypothetical protein BFJ63_vAg17029 [Fusarium oxysporum f. sp. narcissi]